MPDKVYRKKIIATIFLAVFLAGGSLAMGRTPAANKAPDLDFVLQDLSGNKVALSEYAGKVVFLHFWTSWCPPCKQELPTIQKLHQDSDKDGFVILAVNIRENKNTVKNFVGEKGYDFTVLLDSDARVSRQYGINAIPATFIIDRQGKIVEKVVGARHWQWPRLKHLLK